MLEPPIRDQLGNAPIPQSWARWFRTIGNYIGSGSSSGTTANRPTKDLFVGLSYFDSTLGKQIQIKSLNPTVWVDGNGDDPDAPVVVTTPTIAAFVCTSTVTTQVITDYSADSGFSSLVQNNIPLQGVTQCRMSATWTLVSGTPTGTIFPYYSTDYGSTILPISSQITRYSAAASIPRIDTGWVDIATAAADFVMIGWAIGGGGGGVINGQISYCTFSFR